MQEDPAVCMRSRKIVAVSVGSRKILQSLWEAGRSLCEVQEDPAVCMRSRKIVAVFVVSRKIPQSV